jgi:hypothetical protein
MGRKQDDLNTILNHPKYARELCLLAVKPQTRKRMEKKGVNGNTWEKTHKKRMKDLDIIYEEVKEEADIYGDPTSTKFYSMNWKIVFKLMDGLIDESTKNASDNIPKEILGNSLIKSEFTKHYKSFIKKPNEKTKEWIMSILKDYLSRVVQDKKLKFKSGFKDIINTYFLSIGLEIDISLLPHNKNGIDERDFVELLIDYSRFYMATPEWKYASMNFKSIRETVQQEELFAPKTKAQELRELKEALRAGKSKIKRIEEAIVKLKNK